MRGIRAIALGMLVVVVPTPGLCQSVDPTGSMSAPRINHTVTALPDGRILLAGGAVDGASTATAATELWLPARGIWVPSEGLPTARFAHTATLLSDGRVLVVGGGPASGGPAPDAALRDPGTGAWTAIAQPLDRTFHTSTLLRDGRVLILGGHAGATYFATAETFDPATDTFTTIAPMANARAYHTATLLADGRVLVLGGKNGAALVPTSEIFDPLTGLWSTAADLAPARWIHTATLLPDGRVFAAGGDSNPSGGGFLSNTEIWDPGTNTWTAALGTLTARRGHAATLLPDGDLLVIGGVGVAGPLSDVQRYDFLTQAWVASGTLGTARQVHSATILPEGRVLVAGGTTANTTTELWKPGAGSWTATDAMISGRLQHRVTGLADGRILMMAGGDAGGEIAQSEVWSPATETWTAAGSIPIPRRDPEAALLTDGRVLMAGGSAAGPLRSAALWSPVTSSWTSTQDMIDPRADFALTRLADGRVLAIGGVSGVAISEKSEIWDPASETWTATGSLPAGRTQHAGVLLQDGRVLVSGGLNPSNQEQDTTYIWDPATGAWTTSGLMVGKRRRHRLVLLTDSRVLAMGGQAVGTLNTAEVWDPKTGTWSTTDAMTGARWFHDATLLPDGRVLVVGGTPSGTSSEVWDPATGLWSDAGTLGVGVSGGEVALVFHRDWKVMVAGGGTPNAVSQIWTPPLQPLPECRPHLAGETVSLPAGPWTSGSTVQSGGTGLTGCSEASGSAANNGSSPAAFPLIRLVSMVNGSVWSGRFTRSRNWTPAFVEFTVPGDAGLPAGEFVVHAVVNGVSSSSYPRRVMSQHQKQYHHRETVTLGTPKWKLTAKSPLDTTDEIGNPHVVAPQDVWLSRTFAALGEQKIDEAEGAIAALGRGDHVFPPSGFAAPTAISGSWTLRADALRSAGGGGAVAHLFARIKRESDGCLIYETERRRDQNLAELTASYQELSLRTVLAPRAESCTGPCDGTTPCASTVIPAGDRVRLEWWIDVEVTGARAVKVALESPGSSAAAFATNAVEVIGPTPTVVHASDLRARRARRAAVIEWRLDVPAQVRRMRVLRGREVLATATPGPSAGYRVADENAPRDARYVLEVDLDDGRIERHGPVSANTSGTGCALDSQRKGLAGFALVLAMIAISRLASRTNRAS